jgi:hypothetical protein
MLPATAILLYGLASIFIYPTTIEARVSIFSSITTSVTVLFLISERLRDSALRKLEFLNKRAFSPSLRASKGTVQRIDNEQSKAFARSSELLKHHGRFLRLTKLYPKNLTTSLDRGAEIVEAYEKLWEIVLDAGYKEMGTVNFNIWALLKTLGFEVLGSYDATHLAPAKEFFERFTKTNPQLAKEFPIKGKEVLEIKAVIYKKLIDFFADNQLEEARDPSIYPAYAGLPPPYPY